MAKEYRLSAERLEELKQELTYLKTVREKEVAELIKEARSFGDLSENSEYDEAKNEQGKLYSRIAELDEILSNYTIIEEQETARDIVHVGNNVVVKDLEFDETLTYQIVGSQEADPMRGRISEDSPFGRALTKVQCLQYALDKPGVLTVLPGIRNLEDMKEALAWLDASPEERDYSVLGTFTPKDVTGTCVYCNHCAPCPAGLNIGLINKYYDLACAGDKLAEGHYAKLNLHAGDCLHCGHCDSRCPFHVQQSARMEEIAAYFGV